MTEEHWFDRFATTQSRAQVLRGAAFGAVSILPFVRSVPTAFARAGRSAGCSVKKDPVSCVKGCDLTADAHFLHTANGTCVSVGGATGTLAFINTFIMGPSALVSALGTSEYVEQKCRQLALLSHKAAKYDCKQPGCPGFDPCDPLGPCEFALSAGKACCPTSDPSATTGYATCECCGDNGCKSAVSC